VEPEAHKQLLAECEQLRVCDIDEWTALAPGRVLTCTGRALEVTTGSRMWSHIRTRIHTHIHSFFLSLFTPTQTCAYAH